MSRLSRLRTRRDEWSDPHERARSDLAERLDGPVGLAESTWLDGHLAECSSCSAIAAAYESDRQALRALRDDQPEPPRDLWARTAAAIEASGGGRRRPALRWGFPIAALSGFAVVAIMVGVGLVTANLPLGPVAGVRGDGSPAAGAGGPASPVPSASTVAHATPIAVDPGTVDWVEGGPNGVLGLQVTVDEVCPTDNDADCPGVREAKQRALALKARPKSIVASPSRQQAVAISDSATGSDEVVVLDLPGVSESPQPAATPGASASASTVPTAAPSPSTEPASSPSPSKAPEPAASGPTPSGSTETPIASIEPTATPTATAARQIAIASGIEVVGESAAFSPDGAWFAFTARPSGQAGGADVYAWRVGSDSAVRVTDDGASYFASWSGHELIVSRPDTPSSTEADPVSLRIDPADGDERGVGPGWRPAVDPSGERAIVWIGSLRLADDGSTWLPADGTLELRRWSGDGPAGARGSDSDRVITDAAPRDFDVRWDESGAWVAVWVADLDDPVVGRLTLYHVDTETDRLERIDGAPVDVPALPGFSIGDGRLAWATPRGQGGEGSRIQIAAWSKTDVGIVESGPGEDPVVIR